ncbi:uncharacterized protein LOC134040763 [Osmerus eperlanus]|uniref:uncharacterized protein LOC134040763 n=1 Tax=Osmerus eperlanus TaxID=29151 RepID=UPI002E105D1D
MDIQPSPSKAPTRPHSQAPPCRHLQITGCRLLGCVRSLSSLLCLSYPRVVPRTCSGPRAAPRTCSGPRAAPRTCSNPGPAQTLCLASASGPPPLKRTDVVKCLSQIEDMVSKHRGELIPLTKPAGYSLRIGSLQDTVHAESEDQLQVWEDCYLADGMKMVVLGVLDDCSAADGQLVLLLCQDGNVYAYEFEVLHLVARSLKDLFDSGAEFPGQKSFRFGECFNDVTDEEWDEVMQCDEIMKIKEEHDKFQQLLMEQMRENLDAIEKRKKSECQSVKRKSSSRREEKKHDDADQLTRKSQRCGGNTKQNNKQNRRPMVGVNTRCLQGCPL